MNRVQITKSILMLTFSMSVFAQDGAFEGGMDGGGGNSIDNVMIESTAMTYDEVEGGQIIGELLNQVKISSGLGTLPFFLNQDYRECTQNEIIHRNSYLPPWGRNGRNDGTWAYGGNSVFFLNTENVLLYNVNEKIAHTDDQIDWRRDNSLSHEVRAFSNCLGSAFINNLVRFRNPLFYFSNISLEPIVKEMLGLPYDTDQTAVQTKSDIFVDLKKFNKMNLDNKSALILHEIVLYNLRQIAWKNLSYQLDYESAFPTSSSFHSMTRFLTFHLLKFQKGKQSFDDLKANILARMLNDQDMRILMDGVARYKKLNPHGPK